jgi:predicted ester cyclase
VPRDPRPTGAEQLLAIQRELDLAAGGNDGDSELGWLGLVGVLSLHIGSFQGGSSFLVMGKATSGLATGREEPPSSLFNYERDDLVVSEKLLQMISDTNKAAVVRLIDEVWSAGNLHVADELIAPEYVIHHDPGGPWESKTLSLELFKERVVHARTIFPDLQFRILELIAEGDKVAVSWRFRGTQAGQLPGIRASGRQVDVSGLTIYYFNGNQITGHWQEIDRMGLVQQLGGSGPRET